MCVCAMGQATTRDGGVGTQADTQCLDSASMMVC